MEYEFKKQAISQEALEDLINRCEVIKKALDDCDLEKLPAQDLYEDISNVLSDADVSGVINLSRLDHHCSWAEESKGYMYRRIVRRDYEGISDENKVEYMEAILNHVQKKAKKIMEGDSSVHDKDCKYAASLDSNWQPAALEQ